MLRKLLKAVATSAPAPVNQFARRAVAQACEPRVLYSADLNPVLWAAAAASAEIRMQGAVAALNGVEVVASQTRFEIVFVDAGVADSQQLVDALLAARTSNAASPVQLEVIQLNAQRDGMAQITEVLAAEQNVSAIHIISHGDAGRLKLGNSTVDAQTLRQHATELQVWQRSLTTDADILLYGCDVAQGEVGDQFINLLAQLTSADVAASTDPTGSAALGGNWLLEDRTGQIEALVAANNAGLQSWNGLLDITTGLRGHWTFDTNADDSSGNGYNGTLTNGALIGTAATSIQVGPGKLSLDGSNDYVDLSAYRAYYTSLTQGSIAAWIKTTDTQGAIFALSDVADSSSYAVLGVVGGKLNFAVYENNTGQLNVSSTALVDDNAWHHVSVTVNASGNKLYIDGVLQNVTYSVGTAATTSFFSTVTGVDNVMIGTTQNNGGLGPFMAGLIDDVRVYDRALSSADVSQLSFDHTVHTQELTGGGVAFDVKGMRSNGVFSGGTLTPTLTIAGVPAGATIVKAWLYVSELSSGAIDTTFTLAGTNVTAIAVSSSLDAGWGETANVTVKADVSAIVTGNGSYVLGGANALGSDQYQGAVLVVVYSDSSSALQRIVTVSDQSNTIRDTNNSFSASFNNGSTFPLAPTDASLYLATFDGQSNYGESALKFQARTAATATTVVAANSFTGPNGGATKSTVNISALIAKGDTGATLSQATTGADDYLVYPFWASVVTLATPPVNTVPGAQTTPEDTAKVFSSANGNAISITDADAGGANTQVILSVNNGTLTLAGTAGLTFSTGDGTADSQMLFEGTAAAINTALNGLTYTPNSNYNGPDELSVNTQAASLLKLNSTGNLLGLYLFDIAASLGDDSSPVGAYAGTSVGATGAFDATRGDVLSLAGAGYVQTTGRYANPANVSVAAWVNLTAADTSGAEVISLGDSMVLRLDSGGNLVGAFYNGSAFVFTQVAATLAGTGWHHVAYVFDDIGNTATLYLDGNAVASTNTTGSIAYTRGANSFIGKHGNGSTAYDFNGLMDDARVYNRALTANEVATLASEQEVDFDTVAITVTAVNDAPVITSNGGGATAAVNVQENTSAVTTVVASDVDGGTAVYSISGGVDAAKFSINTSTGVLTFVAPPDFETPTDAGANNVYDVTVQVSDGSLTDAQSVAVTVIDVSSQLIVTTTADTNDTGLGGSFNAEQLNASKGTDGAISLREAIIAANNTAGTDTISFNITGAGVHTITVGASALPTITSTVLIDGWSNPNYAGSPVIELNGSNAGSGRNGLTFAAGSSGSTVRGLIINRFTGNGIEINNSSSHTVQGNWIGLSNTGSAQSSNADNGIYVTNSAGNLIGGSTAAQRNVMSGNANRGIYFVNADNSTISGNYVGTDVSGTLDVNGSTVFTNQSGIVLASGSDGNVVGGLTASARNIISGNNHHGLEFQSGSQNNAVQGNYIGTTVTGQAALGNASGGVAFWGAGTGNVLGGAAAGARNVISGNSGTGVLIGNASSGAIVQGNYIGMAADGASAVGSAQMDGIEISGGSINTLIGTDANGSNDAAERNVISGNTSDGIYIDNAGGSGTLVQGNYVGTNAAGTAAVANAQNGIAILAGNGNSIGGTAVGAGNLISGNGDDGISIFSAATTGNLILGNVIGVNAAQTATLSNATQGIWIGGGSSGNTVGGTAAGAGNVIGGSSSVAIELSGAGTDNNTIAGNFIGTNAAGIANFGNAAGVAVTFGAKNNMIGGTAAGAGNLITNSTGQGVYVAQAASTGNAILGNRIVGNAGIGIDLNQDGVTLNDLGDVDTGPNNRQNTPVLNMARTDGAGLLFVTGSMNSTANTQFRVELFGNTTKDASGYGEGQRYLGFVNVTTDGAGNASFSTSLSSTAAIGEFISATATQSNAGFSAFTSSSEFAKNVAVVSSAQALITVDTTSDAADGDISSISALLANKGADGKVSLREAIIAANNSANGSSAADRIQFNIADALVGGEHTISLATALPAITDVIQIDGGTEPDYSAAPVVRIDGASLTNVNGLKLEVGSSGSSIRGLSVTGFLGNGTPGGYGILVVSNDNVIAGNYLGLRTNGVAAGNWVGLAITNGATGNLIGGTTAADRNVISGNTSGGIAISALGTNNNLIAGNYIGVAADGVTARANANFGVQIYGGAAQNRIGGTTAGSSNLISYSSVGVRIEGSSAQNSVLGNSIYANSVLGIDLGSDGVTANDTGDADTGPNSLTNFPVLTNVRTDGASQLFVTTAINSTTFTSFRIEFFANTAAGAGGHGQGQRFLGFANVTTDGTGNYTGNLSLSATVASGEFISATATRTDAGFTSYIETSEFAQTVMASVKPVLTTTGSALAYTENGAALPIDAGLIVTDPDTTPLSSATVAISANFAPGQDVLAFTNQNGITGAWNAATGVLTLSGSSSVANYQTALRSVTYFNSSDNPSTPARTVSFTVNDGAGDSTPATRNIAVTAVNDAPVITSNGGGPTASLNLAENTAVVTTVTSSDFDGGTAAYSIVGGADAAKFTINASTGVLTFITAPNFEAPTDAGADNIYDVTVQVSDGTLTDSQAIAVTVTAVNDNTPIITSNGSGANAAVNVAENSTAVTTVTATDADLPGQTLTYSISGGADSALFAINASTGVLSFITAPNFEAPTDAGANNVYDVTVQVSDGSLIDTQAIAVTVTAVNDNTPVITSNGGGATAAVNVAENSTAVTVVTATDADLPGQTLTYSVTGGADSALFAINASTGALTFIAAPNSESPTDAGANNIYDVTVQVSDGTLTDSQAIAVTITAVNDNTPVITSNGGGANAAVNVAENSTAVTTVTATDADLPGQTLTYSIAGGADSALFAINASTGTLAFITAPNFEVPTDAGSDNIYDVTVQVSDGTLTDSQAIAVTVTAVNDNTPVIASNGGGLAAAVNVAENATSVTTVTATDADLPGQTLTYSISGGVDAALFAINASTGALTFIAAPNFEAPTDAGANNIYDVTVQVSDGALNDTQAITVTVTAVNDNTPVITNNGGGANASVNVAENATAVATVTATDADLPGQTLTYSISGGADSALFAINASTGVLSFITAPNFEVPTDAGANNVYDVTVQVSDGTLTDNQAIAVTVTAVNDNTPTITSNGGGATAAVSVAENATAVTTVTATDADLPGQTLTYSISGGADSALFAINASTGALTFIAAPNFESPTDAGANNVYDVTVQVSDGSLTDTQAIAVTVTAVNDNTPVITSNGGGATAAINVAENATAVTTVTGTDADLPGQTLTYSISGGADSALFTVNASTGALTFIAAPNFEAPTDAGANNVYDVTVQVSDGTFTDSQAIAVTITAVNDNTPVITSNGGGANAAVNVAENSIGVTAVTATDADLPGQTLTYSITGGADSALFTVNASTGVLSFITSPNFEAPTDAGANNVYDVTVQVSDGSLTDSQAIAVTVTAVNDNTPIITSNGGGATAAVNVAENATAVTTVTATDADLPGQTLTYSITGGADAAKFAINATTGVLSFIAAPNFESPTDAGANNIYDVTVQVSDGTLTDSQAIAVTVTAVNDNSPTITSNGGGANAAVNVAENSTAVTTVTATDADLPGQTLTYSIAGGADSALFAINASTGALTFIAAPNFEAPTDAGANNIYDVTVQVSDGTLTDSQAIAVTVTAVNDNTPVITSNGGGATAAVNVAENATAVATVTATDADLPGQTLTYSISGGADSALFAINASTGVLSFIAAPNFEVPTDAGANNVYDVTVQVSDGSLIDTQAIAVTVTAVNDNTPTITSNGGGASAAVNVAENATAVTTVTATDADLPGQTLTYSITGGADSALFAINASTGALTFVTAPNFEAPTDAGANNVYDVTVQVTDGSLIDTQAIAVTVVAVNDNSPTITSNGGGATASINVGENATAVTTVVATDTDLPAQTLTYSIIGGADSAKFAINASTGALTFVAAPDFEVPTDIGADNVYDVLVQVSDGTFVDTQAIAVTVVAVNDNSPTITSNGGGATASINVAENATAVTTVVATDTDLPAQTLTYSIIGGADSAKFAINSSTGALTFVAARNFEAPTDAGANNVYDVVVQVTDGALTDTQAVAVTVTNVNEAPTGTDMTLTMAEDSMAVFYAFSFDDVDAGDSLSAVRIDSTPLAGSLTLSGVAVNAGDVVTAAQLTAGNLVFTPAASANGMAYASFTFSVRDQGNAFDASPNALTVDVGAVNDAPIITSTGAALSYAENSAATVVDAGLTVNDIDNANLVSATVSITTGFATGQDTLAFTNQNGITGVWNAGTGVLALSGSATVAQYQAALRSITYLNGSDNPGTAPRTVSFVVNDGAANSNVGTRDINVTAVNDAPVITSNGGGATAAISVAESDTAVTTVTSTDIEGGAPAYSISGGADAAKFTINASTGVLTFVAAPNFEVPADAGADNVYDVLVQVSDGGLTDTQAIAVTVTAVNDNTPVITSNGGGATAAVNVAENSIGVTTVTATDADLPGQTLTYSISGGADSALFAINASTGTLTFITAPNFEVPTDAGSDNIYDVTVQVSDGTLTDSQAIAVTVTNLNERPTGTSTTVNTAENTAFVFSAANFGFADVDSGDSLSAVRIDSLPLAGSLTLSGTAMNAGDVVTAAQLSAGDLVFTPAIAANGLAYASFNFSVRDQANTFDASPNTLTVNVGAVNDAPVVTTTGSALSYTENAVATAADAGLSVVDIDSANLENATVSISVGFAAGEDTLAFTNQNGITGVWNAGTGVLALSGSATVAQYQAALRSITYVNNSDNPSTAARTVSFEVSDASLNSNIGSRNITVTAVNDSPLITSNGGGATAAVSVAENALAVTTVTSTDVDGGAATYSISGGADAAKFIINASTGVLTFVTAPNFEAPTDVGADNVYDVTVQVTDGSLTDAQAVAVTVSDVNDNTPVITSNGGGSTAAINVAENATSVTTVAATDGDLPAQTLSYSITGGADAAKFAINASTGALSFITAPNFEAPTDTGSDNIYDVTVQVSDGTLTDSQAIAVTVTAVNDNTPTITSNSGAATAAVNVAENTTGVATVTATDADLPGQTLTYSINGGADAALFAINAATGALSFITAPDFEAPTDAGANNVYDVTVQVSDGTFTDSQAIAVTVTGLNDNTPVITSNGGGANAAVNVAENATGVTTVTATDADLPGQTLTYSITGGADSALFTINASTGALTFIAAPNFEAPTDAGANNVYDVTVQVTDGTLTDTQAIAVTVTQVNDNTPVITSNGGGATAVVNVAENAVSVTTVVATDADLPAQTLTYSIVGGVDAAKFAINASTGVLTFVIAPNFEAPTDAGADNVYDVTVQVTDGTFTDTQAVAVAVTDLNDNTPVITSNGGGATAAINVAENATSVTTVTATDADLPIQTLTYSISGGADAAKFIVNASTGVLTFVAPPNFEAPTDANGDNMYDVTVQVTDGSLTDTQAIAVAVTAVNDNTPTITSNGGGAAAAVSVAENASSVTTVTAVDADLPAQTLTYSIIGGADLAKFVVNASTGALSFVTAPDFEAPTDAGANNVYDVIIQVSDGALSDTQAIAVTVTSVNDNTPVITSNGGGATAAINVTENDTAVANLTAADADLPTQSLTFSIVGGADAAKFLVNSATGALTFVSAPDFEAPTDAGADNVYDVTVQVSDGSLTDSQALAITVTDANDGTPVITSNGSGATAAVNVAENSAAVTTITATDADLPAQTLTYSITGGADSALFAINASTGVLTFTAAPDFETPTDAGANNVYDVTVQVSDGTFTDSQAIAVTVTAVNDNTPTITSNGGGAAAAVTVVENATSVTTVTATDADLPAQTLTYSISGGADSALFAINASTGALSFIAAPNFEAPTDAGSDNVYDVTVQVTDGTLTDSQAVAVTVTAVNDNTPTITSNGGGASAAVNVAENATAVTVVTATDADLPGQTLTYSITGGADSALFAINAATGALTFIAAPNFEAPTDAGANNVYDVTVQVSDGSLTDSQAIAVTVTAVNDNTPTITSNGGGATAAVNVAENAIGVTSVTATDADLPGQTLTYSISGGADSALFAINASTGVLTFTAAPDFETPTDAGANNVYDVTVQVSDGTFTDSQNIAVTITDLNDNTPVITSNGGGATAAVNVAENATAVTTVVATDADLPGQTLTYSITGGADSALFTINASTGVLTFIAAPNFEAPTDAGADNVYDVTVQVTDGALTDSQAVSVTLTNVNEAPTGTNTAVSTAENTAYVFSAADFGFADVDAGDRLSAVRIDSSPLAGSLTLSGMAVNSGDVITAAQLSAGNLVFTPAASANGLAYASFNFSVRDQANAFDASPNTITLNVSAVNDAPALTQNQVTITEGATQVISPTNLAATDTDNPAASLVFTVSGVQHGRFEYAAAPGVAITSFSQADVGAARVRFVHDGGEVAAAFSVSASDGSSSTSPAAATITFNNVNDAPTNAAVSLAAMAEDSGARLITQAQLLVNAADVDSPNLSASNLLITNGAGTLVDNGNGTWTYTPALNDDSAVSFSYVIFDNAADGSLSVAGSASLDLTPVNDAPVFNGLPGNFLVPENTRIAATFSASDVDTATQLLSYTINGGADAAQFSIDAITGTLSFINAPDFEQVTDADGNRIYEVSVQVSDGADSLQATTQQATQQTTQQTVRVTVFDVNEAPTLSSPQLATLSDTAAPGTLVITASAVDPDVGDALQFALIGDANGRFVIDAVSGQVSVAAGAVFDVKVAANHDLVVRVTDKAGLNFQHALRVTLTAAARDAEAVPTDTGTVVLPSRTSDAPASAGPATAAPQPEPAAPPATVGSLAKPGPADAASSTEAAEAGSGADALPDSSLGLDGSSDGRPDGSSALNRLRRREDGTEASANLLPTKKASVLALMSFELASPTFGTNEPSILADTAKAISDATSTANSQGLGARRSYAVDAEPESAQVNGAVIGEPSQALSFDQVFTPSHLASVSFSAGFIWWLTRGGGLLTSMLMGVPAWRHVDLLPVLARNFDDEDEEDGLDGPLPRKPSTDNNDSDESENPARFSAAAADNNIEGLFDRGPETTAPPRSPQKPR